MERAQSNVLAVVLLVGITVGGVTIVMWTGVSALESAKLDADRKAAETGMTQLDSKTSLVGLGGSTSQQVSIQKGSADLRADGTAGWMNVSIIDSATGEAEIVVMNSTLGAVYFERDDTTIAYQGGGVWRKTDGGSIMVSSPEFHYRVSNRDSPTVTLPLVKINGQGSLSEDVTVSKDGESTGTFPVEGDPQRTNPLDEGMVTITVRSEFYEAWGEFFDTRTQGNVSYDHARGTARVELTIPFDEDFSNILATTNPNGITANPGPPPSPYQMGVGYPSADSLVDEEINECETNASACEESPYPSPLTAETYYYDSGLGGDLDIDTSAGDVTLVVDGDFTPGTVDVSGPNSVIVYVRGDFAFGGNDEINAGGNADAMTVVVHSDGDVDMNGGYTFVGFVYAPESAVDLNGGGPPFLTNVKGGIVSKTIDVNGNPNKFQYDSSISNIDLELDEGVAKITYLHVSVSAVNVTSQ